MSGSEMPDAFGHTLRATEGLWSNIAEVVMTLKVDPGALGFSVARSTSGDVPLDGLSAFSAAWTTEAFGEESWFGS